MTCNEPYSAFFSENSKFDDLENRNECSQQVQQKGITPIANGMISSMYADGVFVDLRSDNIRPDGMQTPFAARPSPFHFMDYWLRDQNNVRVGDDAAAADARDFVFIGAHGTGYPHNAPLVSSRILFSRTTSANNNECRLVISDPNPGMTCANAGFLYADAMLGMTSGLPDVGKTKVVMFNTSCTLQDRALWHIWKINRFGQAFGWENSPIIPGNGFAKGIYEDTKAITNQAAWITRSMDFMVDGFNGTRLAGPSYVAVSRRLVPNTSYPATRSAEEIFNTASIARRCGMNHSARLGSDGTEAQQSFNPTELCIPDNNFETMRRKQTFCNPDPTNKPCISDPIVCSSSPVTSRNLSALMGLPVRVPSSPATQSPVGSPTITVRLRPKRVSPAEIGELGAKVAGGIKKKYFDSSLFEGIAAQNILEGDWIFKPAGEGISFGFDSTRNRVRFHNANAIGCGSFG